MRSGLSGQRPLHVLSEVGVQLLGRRHRRAVVQHRPAATAAHVAWSLTLLPQYPPQVGGEEGGADLAVQAGQVAPVEHDVVSHSVIEEGFDHAVEDVEHARVVHDVYPANTVRDSEQTRLADLRNHSGKDPVRKAAMQRIWSTPSDLKIKFIVYCDFATIDQLFDPT